MLKSILIGLDGSAYCTTAMQLGIRWARQFDALLVGLGIIDEPEIRRPEPVPIGGAAFKRERDEALLAEARRRVELSLEQFRRSCIEAGVRHTELQQVGLPHEQIVVEAQRYDLILLGQRTYFQLDAHEGPDETLEKILKHSPRPVVTVPEQLREGRSVVVAYDGSLQAAGAVYALVASGVARSARVYVISVHSGRDVASRWAGRAAEFLTLHDLDARALPTVSAAPPADVLRKDVQRLEAGLLVMGAYGKSRLQEFFFGSVTRALLKDSPVPLFLSH